MKKKNQLDEANIRNESLERKCTRLRDYIAKLTKKCEEWSESCRKQSKELRGKKIDKNDLVGQVQVLSSEMKNICESESRDKIDNRSRKSTNGSASCVECKYLRKAIVSEGKRYFQLETELSKTLRDLDAAKRALKNNKNEKRYTAPKKPYASFGGSNAPSTENSVRSSSTETSWQQLKPRHCLKENQDVRVNLKREKFFHITHKNNV